MRTVREAADALGLSDQAVSVWAAKPGAPVEMKRGRKYLRWPEFPKWREQQITRTKQPASFEEAKTREMAARAELAELELAEKRGDLALKSTVQQTWSRVMERVDAKLRGLVPLSTRLVGVKTPVELQSKMEALVEDIREELRARRD